MNAPVLRFKDDQGGEFPEWGSFIYSDIFEFIQTNSFSREMLTYESGQVNNIHYGDIHTKFKSNFRLNQEHVPYLGSKIDLTKIKPESYCKLGDVVIADASEDYADVGKAIEIIDIGNNKVVAGLHTYIARPKNNDMALGFSGYLMQSDAVRLQIKVLATGVSVLSISKGNMGKVNIKLPSNSEQSKIAKFLSAIDEKINHLTQKNELLEQYKKGVMQNIFSQEIRFKDDQGGEFPEWEETTLDKICTIKTGKKDVNEGNPSGEFPFFTCARLPTKSSNYSFDGEAILIAGNGEVGNLNYYNGKFEAYQRTYVLQNFKFDTSYIWQYLKLFLVESLGIGKVGSSVPYIKLGSLSNFIILMPPSKIEQTRIAGFLNSIDEKINNTKSQLKAMKQYKQGLLQQMFV